MLIITGSGRCGTTLVARFLHAAGYSVAGGRKWFPKIRGGSEIRKVTALNSKIAKMQPSESTEAIEVAIKALPFDVVKSPTFVWLNEPRVFEAWHRARSDLRILFVKRDFAETAESFHRYKDVDEVMEELCGEYSVETMAVAISDWYKHAIAKVAALGIPHAVVAYPDICHNADLFGALKQLGLAIGGTPSQELWEAVVEPGLITEPGGQRGGA